jgi:sortase A
VRVIVHKRALDHVLQLLQWTLFGIAVFALSYCVIAVVDRLLFQHRANVELQRMSYHAARQVKDGDLIGRVDVDRLGVSVAVVEGDDASELQHAAGHVEGTALPGDRGNIAIAAHRDTFFRPLKNIRNGDVIRLATPGGVYRYRVSSTRIVKPQDIGVLTSDGREELTLVTCYPFYFIGSAPERFIVRAERIQSDPRTTERAALQPTKGLPHLYK